MKRVRRVFAVALLALGPTACGRGCTCIEGVKTYEKLDGKVKATVVRTTHWGGRIPGPITRFALRVETDPPFDEEMPACEKVDLAEDDGGKHIAYRCSGTQGWTVLRLRGGSRRLLDCKAPVGNDRKPAFEKLDSVRAAADRMLDCASGAYRFEQIVRAVAEDEGVDAAIEVAFHMADRPLPVAYSDDEWTGALAAFDDAARARAVARLCTVFGSSAASPEAFVRAALRCPLDGGGVGALAMVKRLLGSNDKPPETSEAGRSLTTEERALFWAALVARDAKVEGLGAVACEAAARFERHDTRTWSKQIVALLLGWTNTRCPAVEAWLTPPPCGDDLDCDGGLCSRAELAAETAWPDLAGSSDGGLRKEPWYWHTNHSVLFAAYANGPLPRALTLTNERRHYPIAQKDAASCDDDTVETGAACNCRELSEYARCTVDANDTVIRQGYCQAHFDDRHRRIEGVKRVCEAAGAKCDGLQTLCCSGLRCEQPGICTASPRD